MNTDQNQLNPEQEKAVTHGDGPLLIVAGAGTGKTTVISRRIAHLIMEGKCRPEEILALTFTDKAAGEMEERVDKLLPYGYVDLWIQTFHAFAQAVLEHHGLDMGLPIGFKLLNPTQQWLLVRKNLDRFKLDYYRPLGNPTKFIHALLKHFSRAKDETISAQDYLNYVESLKLNQDNADFVKGLIDDESLEKLSVSERKEVLSQEILKQTEVAEAYHTYQQLLLENNALDFGDLISYTLELFKTRKNVLAHYRAQFKYIMVDEFQDTNLAQYELLKLLASPNNNITVVGDDDQSIYKFRGASISNILQFKDDFPESKEIFLNSNYRSRQNLLDLSYAFIKQNDPYRLEVKLQNEKNKKLSKKLIAKDSTVGEIEHLHGATLADEVILVVKKIIELKNSDTDIDWSDFAILVRANASADDFVYALESAGLPYVFLASKGLYAKKIVLDLLAYLKLLDNYHESTAMYRVLTWPLWQLHHQEIVNLNYWAGRKGWSLYETIRQSAMLVGLSVEIKTKTDKVMQFLDKHSQLARSGRRATEIIQAILNDTGYLKILVSTDSVANREQLNFLNQFYKKVQEFEKENNSASLKDFLALVEMELESGEEGTLSQNQEDTGPDTIKIMTIHSAKGLEFKYVFIANMVDKKFPAIAKSDPLELPVKLVRENVPEGDVHLQEERRLMYVAMTRAKQGLYFTSASDYGGARAKKLSRFLIELEDKGLKLASQAEVKKNDFEPKSKPAEKKLLAPINTKFSFTQLSSFETCPYQYRFAYILKIPLSGKPQFSFGKSMHSTL
ncbi:MAG: UvrD-helicase domain-containing protein, partial [bacterium]